MVRWAVAFFIIALIAGLLGFGGLAAISAEMGKTLLWVFIILVVVGLLFGSGRFRG